jgi:hypothetical protein
MTKLMVAFCNFANAPQKAKSLTMAWKTEIKDIVMSGLKNWVVFSKTASTISQ